MKNILLLCTAILISAQSFAQDPDPELFKTWYITEVHLDLFIREVISITPRINPTLTIEETLSFYGEAACNTYLGTLSYDSSNNYFEIISFERTNNDCNIMAHDIFETEFFDFFIVGHSFSPWVDILSNGEQRLYTIGPYYPLLNGKNTPLDVNEYEALKVSLYPNPVTEKLHIELENHQIDRLKIYTMNGQVVLTEKNNTNSVDVSSLSEGVYFMEIFSEEGKSIQKFIKQ